MKRTLFVSTLLTFMVGCFAQHIDFDINCSLTKPNYKIVNDNHIINKKMYWLPSHLQFSVGYVFPNNLEINSGIGFYAYSTNYTLQPFNNNLAPIHPWIRSYTALNIPIQIGYNIELCKQLYLRFKTGFDFDFYFPNSGGGVLVETIENDYYYYTTMWGNMHRFNILISNSLSLYYVTKFNMNVGLLIGYHAGLRTVWENSATLVEREAINEMGSESHIINISKGSYLHCGITLGYRFSLKNKKLKE